MTTETLRQASEALSEGDHLFGESVSEMETLGIGRKLSSALTAAFVSSESAAIKSDDMSSRQVRAHQGPRTCSPH